MKVQSFYAKRIQPLVFMAVITIVCIVLTAALYLFTFDQVQANEQFFLSRSILNAAAIENDGTQPTVASLYQSSVTEAQDITKSRLPMGRFAMLYRGPDRGYGARLPL
ncbi:MAG: hypothetical protein ACOXZ4_07960 [Sphaerochaetaceae bacterium]